jgi:hypothetical protein
VKHPQLNIRIPELMLRQLRVYCAQERTRMQDVVGRALFQFLHPEDVRCRNTSYVFDPNAHYAKLLSRGQSPESAHACTLSMCQEEGIEGWEMSGGFSGPDLRHPSVIGDDDDDDDGTPTNGVAH